MKAFFPSMILLGCFALSIVLSPNVYGLTPGHGLILSCSQISPVIEVIDFSTTSGYDMIIANVLTDSSSTMGLGSLKLVPNDSSFDLQGFANLKISIAKQQPSNLQTNEVQVSLQLPAYLKSPLGTAPVTTICIKGPGYL